jgi:hypothetical protein
MPSQRTSVGHFSCSGVAVRTASGTCFRSACGAHTSTTSPSEPVSRGIWPNVQPTDRQSAPPGGRQPRAPATSAAGTLDLGQQDIAPTRRQIGAGKERGVGRGKLPGHLDLAHPGLGRLIQSVAHPLRNQGRRRFRQVLPAIAHGTDGDSERLQCPDYLPDRIAAHAEFGGQLRTGMQTAGSQPSEDLCAQGLRLACWQFAHAGENTSASMHLTLRHCGLLVAGSNDCRNPG